MSALSTRLAVFIGLLIASLALGWSIYAAKLYTSPGLIWLYVIAAIVVAMSLVPVVVFDRKVRNEGTLKLSTYRFSHAVNAFFTLIIGVGVVWLLWNLYNLSTYKVKNPLIPIDPTRSLLWGAFGGLIVAVMYVLFTWSHKKAVANAGVQSYRDQTQMHAPAGHQVPVQGQSATGYDPFAPVPASPTTANPTT